jgi:hypothetical protein
VSSALFLLPLLPDESSKFGISARSELHPSTPFAARSTSQ